MSRISSGGGEAFELAVAVVVLLVGGAVGDADGEEGDGGGDEVDAGVGGFGEHAERAGEDAGDELEQRDGRGGEHRGERGGALGVAAVLLFGWFMPCVVVPGVMGVRIHAAVHGFRSRGRGRRRGGGSRPMRAWVKPASVSICNICGGRGKRATEAGR